MRQGQDFLPAAGIPDPRRAVFAIEVVAGSEDQALVPIPARLANPILMRQGQDFLPTAGIPDPRHAVLAGGKDQALVPIPARLPDLTLMRQD